MSGATFSGVYGDENGKFEGVGTIGGGTYDKLSFDGVGTINGDVQANSLDVDGVGTVNGDAALGSLDCDGVLTINGKLSAQALDCDGVLTVTGDLRLGRADIDGVVSVKGSKVEADEIVCNGALRATGEISADRILADGFIVAREIVGDQITIESIKRNLVVKLFNKIRDALGHPEFSQVDLIEATTIKLSGVHARQVNGHNITIGKGCKIERIDCSGTLQVDPSAEVTEIVNKPA